MQQIIYHKSTIGKNQNDDDNDDNSFYPGEQNNIIFQQSRAIKAKPQRLKFHFVLGL